MNKYSDIIFNKIFNDQKKSFDNFSIVEILNMDKDYSDILIENASCEGGNDKGIDFIFLKIDGDIVDDISKIDLSKIKPATQVFIYIMQIKNSNKPFEKGEILKFLITATNFFSGIDFFKGSNIKVKEKLEKIYEILNLATPEINFFYIANESYSEEKNDIREEIEEANKEIRKNINYSAIAEKSEIKIIDRSQIILLFENNKKNKTYYLSSNENRMIASDYEDKNSTKSKSYLSLISSDELKKLISSAGEEIYDENVRASLGETKINKKIKQNFVSESNDFWIYNNGITIVCDSGLRFNKQKSHFELSNPSIIDGQQTARTIFDSENKNKMVIVKIIAVDNYDTKNQIIISNNEKNIITPLNILANYPSQLSFEKILKTKKIYYERRKGQFKGETKNYITPADFVNIYYSAFSLKPYMAKHAKTKMYDSSSEEYKEIWNERIICKYFNSIIKAMEIYLKVMKFIDEIKNDQFSGLSGDSKIIFAKFFIVFAVISTYSKNNHTSFEQIGNIDVEKIDKKLFSKAILKTEDRLKKLYDSDKNGNLTLKNIVRSKSAFEEFKKEIENNGK